MSEDIVEQMLAAWRAPFATDHDPRHLLKLGADEIQRLRKILKDYADICQATSREIRSLREAAGLPVDGRSDPESATDTPDWLRPSYRTLGPSTWTSE